MSFAEKYAYITPEEKALNGQAELYTTEVIATDGTPHKVEYVRLAKSKDGKPRGGMLDIPWVQDRLADILEVTRERFPSYTEQYIAERFLHYINNADGLDIITAPDGHVAGFHFYKTRTLNEFDPPIKSMYTHYSAIRNQDEGKNLTEISRIPAIDIEQPDIIVGSTGNPAIHLANMRIAQSRDMIFYPTTEDVPASIVRLGQRIVDLTAAETEPKPVENGLRRTYSSNVARGKGPSYPFFDEVMKLGPNQQILYMMIKPDIHAKIVNPSVPRA